MKLALAGILFLVSCSWMASSQAPGIKAAITPEAVQDFANNYLPGIIANQKNIPVSDISQGSLQITNLVIQSITLPNNAVSVNYSTNQAELSTDQLGIVASFHVNYRVLFVPVSTDATASFSQSTIDFTLSPTFNNNRVGVNVNTLDLTVRNLDLDFASGLTGTVANALTELFQGPLQDKLSQSLSDSLKTYLQSALNNQISALTGSSEIENTGLGIDYDVVSIPTADTNAVVLPLNGTLYSVDSGFEVPNVAAPVELPNYTDSNSSNLQAAVSAYSAETALNALWEAGDLQTTFPGEYVSVPNGVAFTVDWLSDAIPNITNDNDSGDSLIADLDVVSLPQLTLNTDAVTISFDVTMNIHKANQTNSLVELRCTINNAQGTVEIVDGNIQVRVTNASCSNLTVVNSNVGNVNVQTLDGNIQDLIDDILPFTYSRSASFVVSQFGNVNFTIVEINVENDYVQFFCNSSFPASSTQ